MPSIAQLFLVTWVNLCAQKQAVSWAQVIRMGIWALGASWFRSETYSKGEGLEWKQRRMEPFYGIATKNKKCRSPLSGEKMVLSASHHSPGLHCLPVTPWNFIRDHSKNQHGQAHLCGSPSALRLLDSGSFLLGGIPFLREKNVCLLDLDHRWLRIPICFAYLFAYYKFKPLGVSFLNTYPQYFAIAQKRLSENEYLPIWMTDQQIYPTGCLHC